MHTALISGDPHSTYTHNVLSSGNLSKVPRAGSFDPVANNAAVLGIGWIIDCRSVGKLVSAIMYLDASQNRALKVDSFTATPEQILAGFRRQTGDSNWDIRLSWS